MYTEKLYRVLDTEGKFLAKFESYSLADAFRNLANRPDWKISKARTNNRKVTDKMKRAVTFTESTTPYKFEGNIEEFSEVSLFLSSYLDYAKSVAEEAMSCGDVDMDYYD